MLILTRLSKCKKFILLVRSKKLYIRQCFLITNHFKTNQLITNQQVSSPKYLVLILDTSSTFGEDIKGIISKVSETIGLLRKLNYCLPQSSLITIYKLFVRPDFDDGDKAYNNSFQQILESRQYKASLPITSAIKVSSTKKINQELGLESLQNR